MHNKFGEYLEQLRMEKEGFKRRFVAVVCLHDGICVSAEFGKLAELREELPYMTAKYGKPEVFVTAM